VNLLDLEHAGSHALLGPGFGGRRWRLLRGLRAAGQDATGPLLVYAPFERPGSEPFRLVADEVVDVDPSFDLPAAPFSVSLHAEGYDAAVGAIRESIAAGDVYQVCYTVRASVRGLGGAALLALMCRRGAPRFAAWVRLPWGEEFVSASPELFFETRGRRIRAEPMKGTARPDAADALESSEKDRAELAMITDLLRNDLTKVCRPRSVAVACERRVVSLPYAQQTVSDVVGDLDDGVTALDALAALHPGGSVTGAPKAVALEKIRALETTARNAYCGTLGLLDADAATFALLIRTAVREPDGWVYGVGSGIVYDSDATAEFDELQVKLGALSWDTRS
jgi:anthranilate/para-aminobenzoate synthase component I